MSQPLVILRARVANVDSNEILPQVLSWRTIEGRATVMVLDPLTRFTDVVSQNFDYAPVLLVSGAFRTAIATYSLPDPEWAAIDVEHGSETRMYWWLRVAARTEHELDYARSRFLIDTEGRQTPVKIAGADELRATARRLVESFSGSLHADVIAFSRGRPPLDLFVVQLTTRTYFISQALALALPGLTGFELVPTAAIATFD